MRELKILNKNYEVANLYTVVYEGYTIKEIIEDAPVFSVTPPQHYLDYWQKIYDYFKTGTKVPGYTYLPQGQSKYDVAYVNKTIDDPIAELNGHTLREVFEDGNKITNNDFSNGLVGWNTSQGAIAQVNNEILEIKTDTTLEFYLSQRIQIPVGHRAYFRMEFNLKNTDAKQVTFYYGQLPLGGRLTVTEKNVWKHHSIIHTSSNSDTHSYYNIIYETVGVKANYDLMDNIYTIDLDDENLDIGHLSVEQIDYYYSLYQARKNITKKVLTYADIFEGFNYFNLVYGFGYYSGVIDYDSELNQYTHKSTSNQNTRNGYGLLANTYSINDKFYWNIDLVQKTDSDIANYLVSIYSTYSSYAVPYIINLDTISIGNVSGILDLSPYAEVDTTKQIMIIGFQNISLTIFNIVRSPQVINLKHFDESITKEQLDTMLAHYLLVKNIVIYPEIYVPTDPTGFGNRYAFLELNKKVYGHELDFENMQLNLLFGVYKNAYDSYNQLMNFMIGNEGIISYDYGKGVRYSDIRLIKSPKTELDDGRYLKEKFDFKRLTPFYTLEQGSSLTIKNSHDWDLKLIVSGTVNTNIVFIEAEETTSGLTKTVKFDFTAVTKPFNFYYNSETKQILINGINNGYQYIDFTQGISFISLPKDTEHLIWTTGITNPSITIKKWVID